MKVGNSRGGRLIDVLNNMRTTRKTAYQKAIARKEAKRQAKIQARLIKDKDVEPGGEK